MKTVDKRSDQSWAEQGTIATLKPQEELLVADKAAEELKETINDENQQSSAQIVLKSLLERAEASAKTSNASRKKWQLISLVSLLFLTAALYTVIIANIRLNTLSRDQSNLQMDKYNLADQVQSADLKFEELDQKFDLIQSQNTKLAFENAQLKEQNTSFTSKVESINSSAIDIIKTTPHVVENKQPQTKSTSQDQARLASIQKGAYPENMTKEELLASLGKPDRVYKNHIYEQLLYLDRSPGRFWFKNGPFLEAVTE